jgi:hypothetical protein
MSVENYKPRLRRRDQERRTAMGKTEEPGAPPLRSQDGREVAWCRIPAIVGQVSLERLKNAVVTCGSYRRPDSVRMILNATSKGRAFR